MVEKDVYDAACLKQMTYHDRRLQVVVHRLITLAAKFANNLGNIRAALCRRCNAVDVTDTLHQAVKTFLACLKSLV